MLTLKRRSSCGASKAEMLARLLAGLLAALVRAGPLAGLKMAAATPTLTTHHLVVFRRPLVVQFWKVAASCSHHD